MVQRHPSTPEMRAQWSAAMLAHCGEYGVITQHRGALFRAAPDRRHLMAGGD